MGGCCPDELTLGRLAELGRAGTCDIKGRVALRAGICCIVGCFGGVASAGDMFDVGGTGRCKFTEENAG
jgi:hypothetical protein